VGDDDAVHVRLAGQGGDALAEGDRCSLVKLSEAIWKTCSPRTSARFLSSGTPAMSLSTGTLAAW
jgi:hypothetical protein